MKKKLLLLALAFCLVLTMAACGCKHETWLDADCNTAKTCKDCGETEGEPLGHSWLDATCDAPKTCTACGVTERTALGHSWTEATCKTAKFCTRCGQVEGEALGHSWLDATTETPKTCEKCSETEGEKIITDPRFTTKANQHLFGTWQGELAMPGSSLGSELAPYVDSLDCIFTLNFRNDGTMAMSFSVKDESVLRQAMGSYLVEVMYKQFADQGIDRDTANKAMKDAYGVTVEEFCTAEADKMDMNQILGAATVDYCYYADGDRIYLGLTWDTMTSDTYSLENGVLYIPIEGQKDVAFTRVSD